MNKQSRLIKAISHEGCNRVILPMGTLAQHVMDCQPLNVFQNNNNLKQICRLFAITKQHKHHTIEFKWYIVTGLCVLFYSWVWHIFKYPCNEFIFIFICFFSRFPFCILCIRTEDVISLSLFFSLSHTYSPSLSFPFPPLLSQNAKFPIQHLLVFWSQEGYFQRQNWKGKAQIYPLTEFFSFFKRARYEDPYSLVAFELQKKRKV